MTKMPWVRFFPSDWLGGTRGMSAVETGIYITLIATMYERGEPIVEDHARLARLCGASNSAFKKALDTLIDEGKITRIEAGLWNDRVEKEQVYLSEKSEVGSRAANARWGKKHNKNNAANDADALQTQCQGNANQKPDTIYISTDVDIKETRTRDFTSEFESHFWPIYPNKVGKPVARTAFIKARAKVDLETIMAGLRAYVSKTDDRAWCNPSTWLNQERWADAPAQVPRGHAPPGQSKKPTLATMWHDDAKRIGLIEDEPASATTGLFDDSDGSGRNQVLDLSVVPPRS
ncbi:YdaU family protein [Ochrobactrum anthropi]|uniref:YdaU family protein n=1 Tax=Brucella anthropi TaxID=529 RepID=UPI001950F483|nr:YdaU family protein [Brucella anthropi]MBM6396182.1 YdaU family protein [Brucella anthropi]